MCDRELMFTGIKSDFPPMVASSLDAGWGINDTDESGMSPLFLASYLDRREIVSMLIERGADLEFRFQDMTPVMAASEGGALSALEALLAAGADVNAGSSEGLTSLMIAVRDGNIDVAKLLIARGANTELPTQSGSTALDIARSLDALEMVALLDPRISPEARAFTEELMRRTCVMRESDVDDKGQA